MTDHQEPKAINADQSEYWNAVAGPKWVAFQEEIDTTFGAVTEELLARARPASGMRVLDIGCGAGATALATASAVGAEGAVTGIDVSEPLLARAAERQAAIGLQQLDFRLADAQTYRFAARPPYDLLVSRFGVMFFDDPVAAFRNLAGALRPGGRLVFVSWAEMAVNPWFKIPRDAAVAHLGPPPEQPPRSPGPLAFEEIPYVLDILRQAGFEDCRGEEATVDLMNPAPLDAVAAIATNLGISARIVKAYEGTADDFAAIAAVVEQDFRPYIVPGGVSVPARLNFFEATKR